MRTPGHHSYAVPLAIRVIRRFAGDAIEISTDDGGGARVFEGLTPDESSIVVEALEV